jgi:membrane-bound lytic murein transglycosylase A
LPQPGKAGALEAGLRSARELNDKSAAALRAWFEAHTQPWALVNPDGSRNGLITGYYEPILKGSRQKTRGYSHPVFGPPEDMVVVELAELYPELKHLRLRGRLEGRKLVPYYSRAEWTPQESKRSPEALLWIDDPIDLFFMQIQGSGQVQLADGSRVRLNYADQNGHPYRSIGRWLIDKGELKTEQASMQGIKAWAKANPARLAELLNANPSLVFFRELPVTGSGPQGAMGLPLTPERSVAVDPRHVPLGAPIWLATTMPNSTQTLNRLMVGQDTGGAIRGVVRADFYWGSGTAAGNQAGKMRQQGRMWVLLPRGLCAGNAVASAPTFHVPTQSSLGTHCRKRFEKFANPRLGVCQQGWILRIRRQQKRPIGLDLADQAQILFARHADSPSRSFVSASMSMASLPRPVPVFIAIK